MRSFVFDEDDMRMMMRMTARAARIVRIARTPFTISYAADPSRGQKLNGY